LDSLSNPMKTYFTSNEIAHVWAHQGAPRGKCSASMSFNGDAFYSYSTVIARRIERKGETAFILNDRSFSNTTSRHQHRVRMAVTGHGQEFHFSGEMGTSLNPSPKELFQYALDRSAAMLKTALKARKKEGYEASALKWLERAGEVKEFFGLRNKIDSTVIQRLAESQVKAEKEAARKQKEREAKDRAEQAELYEAWKRGDNLAQYSDSPARRFSPQIFPVAFRIEGEELVSTLGARVPLAHARRALGFVLSRRGIIADGGPAWSRNGVTMRVGLYQLDAISAEGVQAGCHRITWEEIERLTSILA